MLKEILNDARQKAQDLQEGYKKELSKLRTGRASTNMLSGIFIDYYGSSTPLPQVATLSVPEANMIVVQPWEARLCGDIEKAIRNANIGLNPSSDGKLVRVPVPPMDAQRRQEIVKSLRKLTEERKTALRNLRRDCREMAKELKDNKDISEDEEKRFQDDLQKVIDQQVKELDEISLSREKAILED